MSAVMVSGRRCFSHLRNDDEIRSVIMEAVEMSNGNALYAAHLLGIHRRTLYEFFGVLYLWPHVNQVRRAAMKRGTEPDPNSLLGRARLTLGR